MRGPFMMINVRYMYWIRWSYSGSKLTDNRYSLTIFNLFKAPNLPCMRWWIVTASKMFAVISTTFSSERNRMTAISIASHWRCNWNWNAPKDYLEIHANYEYTQGNASEYSLRRWSTVEDWLGNRTICLVPDSSFDPRLTRPSALTGPCQSAPAYSRSSVASLIIH